MQVIPITDPSFGPYGRVLDKIPERICKAIMAALEEHTPLPDEGADYVMEDPALRAVPEGVELECAFFGGKPGQLGWCNGHNTVMNAMEYHRSSELNLPTRDIIVLLALREDLDENYHLDADKVKAFLVPAGTCFEMFSGTLHYAPCQATPEGFRNLVLLPAGTNGPKPDFFVDFEDGELIWATDKWLVAHPDAPEAAQGAFVGIDGENWDISK